MEIVWEDRKGDSLIEAWRKKTTPDFVAPKFARFTVANDVYVAAPLGLDIQPPQLAAATRRLLEGIEREHYLQGGWDELAEPVVVLAPEFLNTEASETPGDSSFMLLILRENGVHPERQLHDQD